LKKKILTLAAAVVCLLLSGIYIFNNYRLSTRNLVEKLIQEKKLINILVAGSNRYNDHKHRFYALVSINPVNKNTGITFIPPSYSLKFDDNNTESTRIDEVETYNFKQIRHALKKDLKLNIPFYVELYSTDVENIINLIEGVDLFVLDQVKDMSNVSFGINYFDGAKTVGYINSVEENSIYQKYDRIQDVLLTLFHNKKVGGLLANVEFISAMFKNIKTNLQPGEILKMSGLIREKGKFFTTILPGGIEKGFYVMDEISRKIYEKEFLSALVLEKESEPVAKIKILNGTHVSGLARKMRNNLIRDGLNVVEFGTFPLKKMKRTILISRKGENSAVRKVSEITGIDRIYHVSNNSVFNNVLIIIGQESAH